MGYLLVVCGILVHVILLYSIFDIYFTSPLVHGMTPYKTPLKPPARRVVLFVADGLRADKLFELDNDGQTRAPFLREVVMRHGAWGVSHTRVPTESRPGHVALIAGFYEDVSAVAKGWKENPVEFDSVFNESRYTWSWGSPDILPMFVTDGNRDRVFKFTYPAESEDFAGSDLFKLDTWVFSKVQEFLGTSSSDSALKSKLAGDKVVFFLHLLGIDTNGHAHRPMSQEYLNNIEIMDDGVRNTVELLENYYGHDGKTAYVLTADHGMTDWGSHGAGDPHETLTPLIVWGAGVRRPEPGMARDCDDVYSSNWGLCGVVKRHDVSQADISPLMASLIGIPWPLNSVGILPLEYLNNTLEYKAESLLSNARQILAQYEVKMLEKKATTLSAIFRPFTKLSMSAQIDKLREIRSLISSRKFTEAIHETKSIINLALEGLSYYHSYDRFFLELSITSGFLGWMSYIITLVVSEHTNMTGRRVMKAGITTKAVFYLLRASIVFLLYMQQLPWTYYMYCLLPTLLWEKVVERRHVFSCLWSHVLQRPLMVFILCVTSVMGLEILAMSFFHRELLSLGLVAMAAWPFFYTQWTHQKVAVYGWGVSCVMLAVFPLLPVVGRRANYSLVSLAGCLAIVLAVWCIRRPECHSVVQGRTKRSQLVLGLTLFQIFLLCTSVFLVLSTATSIGAKQGLPAINQYISWLTLGVSVCLPLFSESRVVTRLLNISLSLLSPYLLLSTSHEGLFYLALACLLILWLWLEHSFTRTTRKLEVADFLDSQSLFDEERHLVLTDVRCCYIFVYLINTAFFGTGNIASINSFDPSTVYCFLTVFNPFVMGALMLFKVLIPFILVTCVFTAIHVTVRVPTKSLFLIVLLMSDFMGLHFFFMVQDYGSWLEIGTSISHYVIVMSMIIFIFVLLGVAHVLTTVQIQLTKSHKL